VTLRGSLGDAYSYTALLDDLEHSHHFCARPSGNLLLCSPAVRLCRYRFSLQPCPGDLGYRGVRGAPRPTWKWDFNRGLQIQKGFQYGL
jgi:hypothetical protein